MFDKPVRKIGPNNRSITGKQVSSKSAHSQHFESALERDYLLLLENDADVLRATAQPVTFTYYIGKQRRRYTPDVAVYFKPHLFRRPLLVEIKYQAELIAKKAELEPKFNAAREYCENCGYEFVIITEMEVRSERLYNIRFLSRYRDQQQNIGLRQLINPLFTDQPQIIPNQLLSQVPADKAGSFLFTLWQMVADGELRVDMDKKITMETSLWKN